MAEDRHSRARSIFERAVLLPPEERDRFLRENCGEDPELRTLVEGRLRDHVEKDDPSETRAVRQSTEKPPTIAGSYKLREKIGEGAFGEVWAAEQTSPVSRRVAIKVLKTGMDTKAVLARFEAERQALALMDHPNIARVLDAGETERGRPFFVMDLIQGDPITSYCDRRRLSTTERLELFVQVCQAIQHAHTKGVIHRDVKPSNVLVAEVDGKAVPKVIDFGIAKATAQALTERTLFTMQGQIVGTPSYMSPEQADLSGIGVDTRTDVYSLGVLLYELLTGTLPFDARALLRLGFEAMCKAIQEEEPPKPSTRISSLGAHASAAAERRRTEPTRLTRIVRGELDWITMRALEKDPGRRYQSAIALVEDLERYRRGEAILAGPPSGIYQLKKLLARRKVPVAFGATVLLLVVAFGISMGVLRQAAEKARAEAQERAEELELVTDFQASVLSEIDAEAMGAAMVEDFIERVRESLVEEGLSPAEVESAATAFEEAAKRVNATNAALTLIDEQILKQAAATIEDVFSDRPVTRATLQQRVAETYVAIGLYPQAMTLQEASLSTLRDVLGDDDPRTLTSIERMGFLLQEMGEFDEAYRFCEEAMRNRRRVLGDDHPSTLYSINGIAGLLRQMGRFEESLRHYEEALEGRRRVLGDDHLETIASINDTGMLLQSMDRLEEARPYIEEALDGFRSTVGEDSGKTLAAINNMGVLLVEMGELDAALPYYEDALEGFRRNFGDDHPRTLYSVNNMGFLLQSMGRFEEALVYYEEALEGFRSSLGEEHPVTLIAMNNLGLLFINMDRLEEALPYCETSLKRFRRVLGEDHSHTLSSMSNLGQLMHSLGRLDEALSFYEEALEGKREALGEDHRNTLQSIIQLGLLLVDLGEPEEALAHLVPIEARVRETFKGSHLRWLGRYLTAMGSSRVVLGVYDPGEANLTEAWTVLESVQNPSVRDRERVIMGFTALYEAWHSADPTAGHDAKGSDWKAKLATLKEESTP